jgi:hypothetical protein
MSGSRSNAAPEPQCVINDYDLPTNVRTQPNGVIVGNLNNGAEIRIVDQTRAINPGRWPVGGLGISSKSVAKATNGSPTAGSTIHSLGARDNRHRGR